MAETTPGLRLHKRTRPVDRADVLLRTHLLELQRVHDLTYAELAVILTNRLQDILKYELRIERHGTTDKKADEA